MRKVLFSLACWLTLGLASSQASVDYRYIADQTSYAGLPGTLVTVNLYLQETVTGASTSLIFKEGGLFGADGLAPWDEPFLHGRRAPRGERAAAVLFLPDRHPGTGVASP